MKFTATALLAAVSGASAFSPFATKSTSFAPAEQTANGWTPDASKFAYGLPGSIEPVPEFDPLGFTEGADLQKVLQFREAEIQHGRVAMLGALGMLVTEEPIEYHPLFQAANKDIGPAIRHLDEVRAVSPAFFEILGIFIAGFELSRALKGWTNPGDVFASGRVFKEGYYPGDIGFDPLNLKPTDATEFAEMQTKELQNGRLAMLGWAGMVAQELINGQEIFVNAGLATDRFNPDVMPVKEFLFGAASV